MSKLDRIGAMSRDFDTLLAETRDWIQPVAPGKLDIMDFPAMLAHRQGIHNVEEQQFHFLLMERSYCEKVHGRLEKSKSRMVDMPLDMIDQDRTRGRRSYPDYRPAQDTARFMASRKNIAIIMEERGPGILIDTLATVIQDSEVHANPDMGNWKDEESLERGLRLMYPLGITVSHVKWNPDRFSLATAVGVSKKMGFKDTYSNRKWRS